MTPQPDQKGDGLPVEAPERLVDRPLILVAMPTPAMIEAAVPADEYNEDDEPPF